MSSENKNFLALGNIDKAINKTKFGEEVTFGGGTYSAVTARRLGYQAAVLTKGNEELMQWISNLEKMKIKVFLEKDKSTLSVINDYSSGKWMQKLLTSTEKINFDLSEKFDVIHMNPLFKEVDVELIEKARKNCKLLSLDAQGLIRDEKNGIVYGKFLENREDWFKHIDVLHVGEAEKKFVSKETDPESICRDLQSMGSKIVLLTLGAKGSFVLGKEFHKIPAFKVREIDPTGAGDVYSTSFDIKYFETENERESGFFASVAASFCVEDFGYKNVQTRKRVEERFKRLMKEAK